PIRFYALCFGSEVCYYNVVGHSVQNITNSTQAPGKYTVQFDNKNLLGGIYFVRMEASEVAITRTMTVVM
ncbi:MAG: hypothetical protein ABIL18_06100, partial [candidate division WOR-3 bacterium]